METIEYTTLNREGWPPGEWDSEPDKVQWPDDATGLPCLAVRHEHSGHWCGYVGVDQSHPLHGVHYGNAGDFDVHGGLTFSDSCKPSETEDRGVCHIPGDGEPDHVWWFGFDCHHCFDYSPQDKMFEANRSSLWAVDSDSSYKTLGYVKSNCRSLARQLKEAEQ